MVKFRVWKVDSASDMVEIIKSEVPSRRSPVELKTDGTTKISYPSVHIEISDSSNDRRIVGDAFSIYFKGTRADYVATLIAKAFTRKGFKVDNWE